MVRELTVATTKNQKYLNRGLMFNKL